MKREEKKILADNSCLSPGSPSQGAAFPYQPLAVFPQSSHPAIVSQPRRCSSEPFLLKARGQRSEELLVSGFHPRGSQPQGGASRAGLLFKRHVVCFHYNSGWMPDVRKDLGEVGGSLALIT